MMESWNAPSRPVLGMNMNGGRPCLDLLNTLIPAVPPSTSTQTSSLHDLLDSYADFIALSVRTASLTSGEADALLALSNKDPAASRASLASVKDFRSLLRRILLKSSRGISPATRDLAAFEEIRSQVRSFEVLVWEDGRFRLRSRYLAEGLAAPLNAFVRDADELLRSPSLPHIHVVRAGLQDSRFILE